MGSKRRKRVRAKSKITKSSSAGDEIPADNCLSGLTDTWLPHLIDFEHGLLDELFRHGVINRDKFESFRNIGLNNYSSSAARGSLMNDVITASTVQKEHFLSALDRTQQSHVTNYIRHNGRRPADTDDNWPLFGECRVIDEHFNRLVNLIDIECGLLDEIIAAGFINEEQRATVSANNSSNQHKVRELLCIMQRKSVADYKKFIDCLVKTKQFRVLSMLDPSTAAANPPLSKDQRAKLDANQSALVELIDIQHSGLLIELQAVECLTYKQMVYIESTDNALDSTRRLLDILRRGGQSEYEKFILCLGRTRQHLVVNILLNDAAPVAVSLITAHGTAVDKYQSYVVEAFVDLLRKSTTVIEKEPLIQAARALGHDNELKFMKTGRSITLFIASRSLSGLIHLYDIYLNTQLKTVIQQIFNELLANKNDVLVDELIWDKLDYNKCVQRLAEASTLSIYPKIYQYSSDITTEPPVCSLVIDRFPHELIEKLLMTAASQLFVSLKTTTTNAATYTFVTLSAVCRYWRQTLTCRRANKQRLRRYFSKLCHPFSLNPRLVTSLQIEGKHVASVVTFGSKLYVVTGSNAIDVYDWADSSSYVLIECIKVPGLMDPSDSVLCSSMSCLFISDFKARCIWRVNLLSDSNVVDQTDQSPFIRTLQCAPRNLSVQFERLLVTLAYGNAIYVYNTTDVERSQSRINLPDYMDAQHAVETSRRTFVVAYWSKCADETRSGVSELSADGHVLLIYNGPTPFSFPFYITAVKGHFLVSDNDNHQILHLNTDLELTRVIIADTDGNPLSQCYSLETGMLYVAHENSGLPSGEW